jgi:hypothetical protein
MANIEPWELAKNEGKTIIIRAIGPMVAVYYPYRRSGDLYVVADDKKGTSHCCQCDQDFPTKDFINHVNSHNKHFKKFPHVIVDSNLVKTDNLNG